MKYLFDCWDKLKEDFAAKYIYLFLDYDGTLVPIAKTPDSAVMPQRVRDLLKNLAGRDKCEMAIISGRGLKDIKNLVGIEEIIYAGNHGLEIEGPKIKFESFIHPQKKNIITKIRRDLEQKLSKIKGVFIEDKGLTLSVHYRLVKKEDIPSVEAIFCKVIELYTAKNEVRVAYGKMVFEVRPTTKWDKGKIILWLLARQQFYLKDKNILPVYIGDDLTDEDAFKTLRNNGITIFVGEDTRSCAEYYLKNSEEVIEFLNKIAIIMKEAV